MWLAGSSRLATLAERRGTGSLGSTCSSPSCPQGCKDCPRCDRTGLQGLLQHGGLLLPAPHPLLLSLCSTHSHPHCTSGCGRLMAASPPSGAVSPESLARGTLVWDRGRRLSFPVALLKSPVTEQAPGSSPQAPRPDGCQSHIYSNPGPDPFRQPEAEGRPWRAVSVSLARVTPLLLHILSI